MELILTDTNGLDLRRIDYVSADFDIGNENDFEIIVSADDWREDVRFGSRLYVPNTEYGGIIGELETNTQENAVYIRGYTWRGLVKRKIIVPPSGSAYKTVSGDLTDNLSDVINGAFDDVIRADNALTGVTLKYSFDRYTDMLSGLTKMLLQKNYKLKFEYIQKEMGTAGYVKVSAVPVVDYSDKIELSQDSRVDFTMRLKKNVINHLIVLGEGELTNREVLHLYLNDNGEITNTQHYFGIDEIAEVYENTGSEDLETDGINHFREILKSTSLSMDIANLNVDVSVGDIVGGRDYITGVTAKKPLSAVIITDNGTLSIEYQLAE